MVRISVQFSGAALAFLVCLFGSLDSAVAQTGKSIGRFNRVGLIASITDGNIAVTHDDGRQEDYSTYSLTGGDTGNIIVTGKLPATFIVPGMLLSSSVKMTAGGRVTEPVGEFTFVNDQSQPIALERTDADGVFRLVGKVMRRTPKGYLLKVPKSTMAKQGRISVEATAETKLLYAMKTLEQVNPGDTVESMLGVVYEGGVNVVDSIAIELSPHRQRKTEGFTPTEQLFQKYAYLSDDNEPTPKMVKLKNYHLLTDMSPLQTKVLGVKLETMYEAVKLYYRKGPREKICCQIVADANSWDATTSSVSSVAQSGGHVVSSGVVTCSDDHDVVLRGAFEAFCRSTFTGVGPAWYHDGMGLMANYWQPESKEITVASEIVAALKSSSRSLESVVMASSTSSSSAKERAYGWALCYMMINSSNYSNDFRKWGAGVMMGGGAPFEIYFNGRLQQIDFEYRQLLANMKVGYRADLCEWNWEAVPKKLYGSDMSELHVDSRSGWQATKIELVAGETYEYVAKGEWQTDPEFETSTANGLNGSGQLVGTIFTDFQLSETIRMGERGKFTATTDGHLFLRCDDSWDQIEDNKGRVKVFVRKAK